MSTSVVVINCPPCASPVMSIGLRLARAAYTAAVRVLLLRTGAGAGDPILLHWGHAEAEPCACNDPLALAGAMSKALERLQRIAAMFPGEEEHSARLAGLYQQANWWPPGAARSGGR